MPERTRRELDKLEKRADAFIDRVREAPGRAGKTLGKEYRELSGDVKRIMDRVDRSMVDVEERTKKNWRVLSERTRKLMRRIEREWTSVVREPTVAPVNP